MVVKFLDCSTRIGVALKYFHWSNQLHRNYFMIYAITCTFAALKYIHTVTT